MLLTDLETFGWGLVGGAAAYVAVFIMPRLPIWIDKGVSMPNFPRLVGVILAIAVYITMGGLVAVLVGEATHYKQAIAYGIAWESLVKAGSGAVQSFAAYSNSSSAN